MSIICLLRLMTTSDENRLRDLLRHFPLPKTKLNREEKDEVQRLIQAKKQSITHLEKLLLR